MSKNRKPKMVHGMPVDDYFETVIGPMSISIMEKLLYRFIQCGGEGMTGAELKIVQFAMEKSYGTATRQVEVTTVNEQEIAVDDLKDLDPATLERIASMNAKRDDDRTVN